MNYALVEPAGIAFVVTALLMPVVRRVALAHGYLDVPNDQSSHVRPTPRVGGYAMLAGMAAGISTAAVWTNAVVTGIAIGVAVLGVAAFVDDRRPLPRVLRLFLQLAVGALVVVVVQPPSPWLAVAVVIWMVAVINAYNFMDGLNGMAGITAVVVGLALATLAMRYDMVPAAVLAISMAAAAAAFLPFNLFSGSVFMGDAGSTALGLVFGALAVELSVRTATGIAAILPLVPFVLDAWTTIARRALRGERFFSTRHRTSYYQLLHQLGWSHEAVAVLYGGLAAVSAAIALVFEHLTPMGQGTALLSLAVVHATIFFFISRSFHAARIRGEA